MFRLNRRAFVVGMMLLVCAALTFVFTPRSKMSENYPHLDLEKVIPQAFGDWTVDPSVAVLLVAPDVQAKLDEIYNQTLSRTYVNSYGEQVMLSLAYGGDQSDAMQAHLPDVCYPAQGFEIVKKKMDILPMAFGDVPVKRLVATRASRVEPITYWLVVGDQAVVGGLERKVAKLRYGLQGQIPEGILIRVSSISGDIESSYSVQDNFLNQLATVLPEAVRSRVMGNVASL